MVLWYSGVCYSGFKPRDCSFTPSSGNEMQSPVLWHFGLTEPEKLRGFS